MKKEKIEKIVALAEISRTRARELQQIMPNSARRLCGRTVSDLVQMNDEIYSDLKKVLKEISKCDEGVTRVGISF